MRTKLTLLCSREGMQLCGSDNKTRVIVYITNFIEIWMTLDQEVIKDEIFI